MIHNTVFLWEMSTQNENGLTFIDVYPKPIRF